MQNTRAFHCSSRRAFPPSEPTHRGRLAACSGAGTLARQVGLMLGIVWAHVRRRTALFIGVLCLSGLIAPAIATESHLLVTNRQGRNILRYDATTGAFVDVFIAAGAGGMNVPWGMAIGPDGRLYVSSLHTETDPTPDPTIRRFDVRTGAYLGIFAAGQGMQTPTGLAFGPDGHLYVSDFVANKVFRFDGVTGQALGVFVSGDVTGGGAWGPDGNYYLSAVDGVIPRHDRTGAPLRPLRTPETGFGRFNAFGPDGWLYATDYFGGEIHAYDIHSGALVRSFRGLNGPQGFAFPGPNQLLVTSFFNNRILKFEGASGSPGVVFTKGPPLDGPLDLLIVAGRCEAARQDLSALVTRKSGTQEARQWTLSVSNRGRCPSGKVQIDAVKLTQTFGVACTPVITGPTAFPLTLGDIAAAGRASAPVTINFSACSSTARFRVQVAYSAEGGAVTGTRTLNNQFR